MSFLELKINEKKEQKLLSRSEIKGSISFDGTTPSNDAVKDALAKSIGKDAKLVVVKHVYTDFGKRSALVLAYAYDNEEKLKEIEVKKKKVKANAQKSEISGTTDGGKEEAKEKKKA